MVPMQDLLDAGSIETLVARLREIAAAYAGSHSDLTAEVAGYWERDRVALTPQQIWRTLSYSWL
jgi:hypothetical protein